MMCNSLQVADKFMQSSQNLFFPFMLLLWHAAKSCQEFVAFGG
jgi:hypothetical protein